MTATRARISLTIVCFVFGVALVLQLRTENRLRQAPAADSSTDLAAIAGNLYDSNSSLRAEVDTLQADRFQINHSVDVASQVKLQGELQTLQEFNGIGAVTGSGVELTVDANLRPMDLLDLLNEVRNAGAEATSIGGQRVVFNTPIAGIQGRLLVNNVAISTPVVITALGQADVLDRALARKGGMISYLRTSYPNAKIDLQTRSSVKLPAYTQSFPIKPGA